MNKYFIGIDHSFNSTGIIVLNENADIIKEINFSLAKYKEIEEKLIEFKKELSFTLKIKKDIISVYIEGPSYRSTGAYVLQMGALHYILRLFLYKNNINFKVIAPGTLKKFITGNGQSKKNLILLKVYKKWNVEFSIDDLADAYGLARMALEEYKNG